MTPLDPNPSSPRLDVFDPGAAHGPTGRPSIRVWFRCANAYQRVFRSVNGKGYSARCPRCGKCMRFRVGDGGTSQRSFEVSC